MRTHGCPGCSHTLADAHSKVSGVALCRGCGAVYTTRPIYLGESYLLVFPRWADLEPPAEEVRYFDLECLGSEGLTRRHGWFHPATRRVVQVG